MTDSQVSETVRPTLTVDVVNRAILNSIQTRIAVLDSTGTIMVVNDAWRRAAEEGGDISGQFTGEGVNYLKVTQRAAENGDGSAEKALVGIQAVLNGERDLYELRYPCHTPTEEHWFLMRVTALHGTMPRGVVISHIDITVQHISARNRARRADRRRQARRDAREFAAMQTMVNSFAAVPKRQDDDLLSAYILLVQDAVEQRTFRVDHDLRARTRKIAAAIGQQTGVPRDLVDLHTQAMEHFRSSKRASAQLRVYLEEGRLLLIEAMGYLALYYRDLIIADLEQRGL